MGFQTLMVGRHEGSYRKDMLQRHAPTTKRCVVHTKATCMTWHVAGTRSEHLHTHENVCGYMFQGYVAATCAMKFKKLIELHGTRRGDKITLKLVLHNYKSISSHEGTCGCNISLKRVPATFATFSCCDFVSATSPRYTSQLNVTSACTTQVFCRCNMSLQHVPVPVPPPRVKLVSLWRQFFLDPTLWGPIGQLWRRVMADREIQTLHPK